MIFITSRTNPFTKENILYTKDEIDYFFLYCIENQWCGLISIDEFSSKELKINLCNPTNNNYVSYKMHDDYNFDRKIYEIINNEKVEKIKRTTINNNSNNKTIESFKRDNGEVITRSELKEMIRSDTFTNISKYYGVTDNAIREWCKKFNLPCKVSDIQFYSDEEWISV